ncbi:hypothetical protein [Amycolatopsis anabasis]|uniref:hypothetical protein n=1 Tax=Amycolatopsis anabasis TaxID=1840409 RepID=UPI001FE9DEDA|nr:hypothetical protein [Amycolatopsis anabasis]
MDLLDLYRGRLSYRRVCALVTHLPDDAAVWRLLAGGVRTRSELLLAAVERRVTALWATVAAALGQDVTDAQLASPLDAWDGQLVPEREAPTEQAEPEVKSLREIALWMRNV